jgi:hypothetical protein
MHFCIFYEYCSILVYTSIEDFEYCNTSIVILQYSGHPNRYVARPSVRLSVRPSVTYFSAGIAPRELKF